MGPSLVCRRPTSAALMVFALAGTLGHSAVWAAELDPVALLWNAPVGCSTGEAVRGQVETSLGDSAHELAPVAAVVDVTPGSPGRWRAKLRLHSRGERTERQFEAESCDGLSAAAALIIALAAEGTGEAPAAVAGDRRPPPAGPDDQVLSATSVAQAPRWNRLGLSLQIGLTLDNGSLPKNSEPGLVASVGEIWGSDLWRLRLLGRASYFLPQDNLDDSGSQTLGRYSLLSLSGRGCLTAALLPFEFGPCVGGEAVAMHGSSIGEGAASSTQYWLAPVGAAVAAFDISPQLVLFAEGEIAVPGTRRTFMGDSPPGFFTPVYTVRALSVRAAAGVELRFF